MITISSTTTNASTNFPGSTCTLRIYSSLTFTADDGTPVMRGTGSGDFFKSVACTISDGIISIPSFTIPPTTNALDDNSAKYTAVFYDSRGIKRDVYFADFRVPDTFGSVATWAQLRVYKRGLQPVRDLVTYTKQQVDALIALAAGALLKASTVIYGLVRLSVAPASASAPTAVGDNDPRVPPLGAVYWASHYDSLGDAILMMGSSVRTTLIVSGVMSLANVTVPSTVTLMFVGAGAIQVVTGNTVNIRGPLNAEPVQIFTNATAGLGTITFTGNKKIATFYSEWWGAIADGTPVDGPSFLAAYVAASTVRGGTLQLFGNTYNIGTTMIPIVGYTRINGTGVGIDGSSQGSTFIKYTGTAFALEEIGAGGDNSFTLSNLTVVTTGTTSGVGAIRIGNAGISVTAATNASPCVITTSVNHGLTTGQSALLAGFASTLGTALNGAKVVTVLSPTSFSVAVNTTATSIYSGTGATAAHAYNNSNFKNKYRFINVLLAGAGESNAGTIGASFTQLGAGQIDGLQIGGYETDLIMDRTTAVSVNAVKLNSFRFGLLYEGQDAPGGANDRWTNFEVLGPTVGNNGYGVKFDQQRVSMVNGFFEATPGDGITVKAILWYTANGRLVSVINGQIDYSASGTGTMTNTVLMDANHGANSFSALKFGSSGYPAFSIGAPFSPGDNRTIFDPACEPFVYPLLTAAAAANYVRLSLPVLYAQVLTPSSVAANTTAEQDFTVTGLTTSDSVIVNGPAPTAGTGIVGWRVKSANTLSIVFSNNTAGALTPAAGTYNIQASRN